MRDYIIVGLTGPTGAGKSTASEQFSLCGYEVISADSIAREIMSPGSVCVRQLALSFGKSVLNSNGTINRRALAQRAFSSQESTQLLNDITHPQIFLRTLRRCRKAIDSGRRRILFDAPVLFESSSDLMCDEVIAVTAPQEIRLERLIRRDGLSREEVLRRMAAQHNSEYYESRSDFVINGGAPMEEAAAQARRVIEELERRFAQRHSI